MRRKDRQDDWDNGMTIAPMNGDELPKYRRMIYQNRENTPRSKREKSDVTRKEQRAMIRAMFEVMLPRILVVLVGFGLTALIIWLWLSCSSELPFLMLLSANSLLCAMIYFDTVS